MEYEQGLLFWLKKKRKERKRTKKASSQKQKHVRLKNSKAKTKLKNTENYKQEHKNRPHTVETLPVPDHDHRSHASIAGQRVAILLLVEGPVFDL